MFILRIVVATQCLGVAGRYYLSDFETESDVYGVLFYDLEWAETTAQRIDDIGMLATMTAGCLLLLTPLIRFSRSETGRGRRIAARLIEWCSALVITGWVLALSITHMIRGEPYSQLSLGEHAVRFVAPLALLWIGSLFYSRVGVTLFLSLASAATFIAHGYKAWDCYGGYVDLILLTAGNWTQWELEQSVAETALVIIGLVDIAVAIIIVLTRWRWVAAYMALWGGLTAASRITALGWSAWPETLIRSANWGIPLVLAVLILPRARRARAAS